MIKYIQNESTSMAIGTIYPDIAIHKYFDYSIGYLYDYIHWVVPLAQKQPAWLIIGKAFRLKKNFQIKL